jgi:hypothetical protein
MSEPTEREWLEGLRYEDKFPFAKQHYQRQQGRWRCRDTFGDWWWMPGNWKPGQSIEGFVWR